MLVNANNATKVHILPPPELILPPIATNVRQVNIQIHWVIISEPNRANNDPGRIYVWLTDIGDKDSRSSGCNGAYINFERKHDGQPRAYVMPYSVEKHKALEEAMSMIKGGSTVLAGRPGVEPKGDQSEALSESDDFIIYKLPEVLLQPK